MERTYSPRMRPLLGLGLSAAAALAAGIPAARAAMSLFGAQPLDGQRFAVLARPVGAGDWNLLVLEQVRPQPLCWQPRADGLIDPALNRFDFTGICSRYLDSNGYSLRIGDEDLASRYRLRLEQRGDSLALLAMSPAEPVQLVVGRGSVPLRDRDGFVAIQLEPGWQLQRRIYGQQSLSHLYFANATPLQQLLASARGGAVAADNRPSAGTAMDLRRGGGGGTAAAGGGPIALQVIPYQP
jgi:hypothetical protein